MVIISNQSAFSPEAQRNTQQLAYNLSIVKLSTSFVWQEDSMSSSLSLLALLTSLCMVLLVTNSIIEIERIARFVLAKMVSSSSAKDPGHLGALSFLGPRSLHTVVQPNPSEGGVTVTSF